MLTLNTWVYSSPSFLKNISQPASLLAMYMLRMMKWSNNIQVFFLISNLETHLESLPSDVDTILGGDFNASIGICTNETDCCIIGPYGLPHHNAAGDYILDLARQCQLQVNATYKVSRCYGTFYDLHNNHAPHQLDLIMVSQHLGTRVTDAKVYQPRNGVVTDHLSQHLKLRLLCPLAKRHPKTSSSTNTLGPILHPNPVNYCFLHQNGEKCQEFQEKFDSILFEYVSMTPEEATPTQLSEAIAYAAKCTITEPRTPQENWFDASKPIVRPLHDAAQSSYQKFLADGSDTNKSHWHSCRCQYYRVQ